MNKIFTFLLAVLGPVLIWGQEELSLTKAIEMTLENNYLLKIEAQNLEIARSNNDWAIAGRYPSIDATFSLNNGYTSINNPASFLTELSTFSTGIVPAVEASWILFDGYRVKFTKSQLEKLEELSEGNIQVAVENAIQATINAYYAALIQEEQLLVLQEVLALSRDRIDYQEVRKEFGQAGTFDLLQAQDAYFNDSTSYLTQKNSRENALRSLNLAMGVDDFETRYELTDRLEFLPEDYELEAIQTKMLANNKTLQTLFTNRELANINTKLEESTRSPTLSVRGGLNYNYNLANGNGTLQSGQELELDAVKQKTLNGFANFTLTYNLFDAGVKKKRIQNAQKEEIIAQLNVEDFKRTLSTQLNNTFATYNSQKELVLLTNELLENARENITIAEERFKGGLINSFDYRTIQLNYINASQSRLNAIFNLKNTETELIKLIGGLVR